MLKLVIKCGFLCSSIVFSMVLLFVLIPEGNDIAFAHVDKHDRLSALPSPKVVFVGGSNLMYGLDSTQVERELGMPVVNMGLNGYIGPRFLVNELEDDLRAGDVVVLSFEYEAYYEPTPYNSIDGVGADHLLLVKLRPESARYLDSWAQYLRAAQALPQAVQQKLLRLLSERLGTTPVDEASQYLNENIEIRAGFNAHGDLVSHLEVAWPYNFYEGRDLEVLEISEPLLDLIADFHREMSEKGVTVVVAPPPAPQHWFDAHREHIEAAFARVDELDGGSVRIVGAPHTFVYPRSHFFDDANHLNGAGRPLRTQALLEHLGHLLAARARPSVQP